MPEMANVCLGALVRNNFEVAAVIPPPNSNPTAQGFIDYAKSFDLEVFEYDNNPNNPDLIEKIKSKKADIGVICSFDKLLKKGFLDSTKHGFINCHPSLLPNYRGANPYFHIINNNEKTSGVTLHFADEHFDTGNIIIQKGFSLLENETIGTLFSRCNFMIADLLVQVLSDLQEKGELKSCEQISGEFKKAPKISPDIKIDLNRENSEIDRLIRATNPFYCAFLIFRGVLLKVVSAEFEKQEHDFEIGLVVKSEGKELKIATKEGFMRPKIVQCGSWGFFDAEDFIKVFRINVGEFIK